MLYSSGHLIKINKMKKILIITAGLLTVFLITDKAHYLFLTIVTLVTIILLIINHLNKTK